jgi:hypothetical protein
MNNLKQHCEQIQQSPNNGVEYADCTAIKFDKGFTNKDKVVDYIDIFENGLVMIEMKDLQLKIRNNFKNKPTKEELEEIFKNMIGKFKTSYELVKQEISADLIDTCRYLVWKNNTEVIMMDRYLPTKFKDRPYQICKTNEICSKLQGLNTRLCQE